MANLLCIGVIAVGGLSSPIRGSYKEPLQKADSPPYSSQPSSSTHTTSDELPELWLKSMSPGRKRTELNKDDDGGGCDEEEEKEENAEEKMSLQGSPPLPLHTHHHNGQKHNIVTSTVSELELRKLEIGEGQLCVFAVGPCVLALFIVSLLLEAHWLHCLCVQISI